MNREIKMLLPSTKDKRVFVIPDIHGEYNKLENVIKNIIDNAGFSFEKDFLIQLGDRNDRGSDTYKVNEFFRSNMEKYPGNVFAVNGNHDDMLMDAALDKSDLMYFNGGNKTLESYSDETKLYGKRSLSHSLQKTGHWDWHRSLPYYLESEDYFFCHAPQALEKYKESGIIGLDPRSDRHALTWTYVHGIGTEEWVDPNPFLKDYGNEFKIAVYGHIHGIWKNKSGTVEIPGVRRYGNAILLDTGSGCHPDAVLTCLELPSMKLYTSDGSVKELNGQSTSS